MINSVIKLTSPTVVRDVLARQGIRLRKELGQHFLVDENVLHRIVEAIEPAPEDVVVEVGAGLGTLTVALAPHVGRLYAVEIDERLVPLLRDHVAPFAHVVVVPGDFRGLALAEFGERLVVVGNLPYGITSEVLLKLVRERVGRAVLMVQAEVGEKLLAPPGPEASRLGVHLRAYYDVELVRKVARAVFFPPPEVDSVLIKLHKRLSPRTTVPDEVLEQTLALVFSARRKTLRRLLSDRFSSQEAERILDEVGLDGRVRGEALDFADLDRLAHVLWKRF